MRVAATALVFLFAPSLLGARPLDAKNSALPRVGHIFIDFDGTIAVTEAFETLADAAYASVKDNSTFPPWSFFSDTYNDAYDAFSASFGPRTTLSRELQFQTSLDERKIESDSFDRVSNSHVFAQTQFANLLAAAKNVQLRDGFFDLLGFALTQGIQPAVVSLNWSPSWIRLVLRVNAHTIGDKALAELIPIYCSEILPPTLVRPPNPLDRSASLFTGGDKVALISKLIKRGSPVVKGDVVFIGDSKADLPPLLSSPTTIGIVAAGSGSMNKALQTFGVHVIEANATNALVQTGQDKLLTLFSFSDIVGKFRGPLSF